MEKNKKKVLIIIGLILITIAVITILLSKFIKTNNKDSNIPNNTLNENALKKDIELLDDVNKFFSIQKLINDFYLILSNRETDKILNVLDDNYINSKGITAENIYNNISTDYGITTYVAKNIYYNPNSVTTYYFVNGYLTSVDMMGEDSKYYESINYLITVDGTTNKYTIIPLENNLNLQDYAKKYNIEIKKINNDFSFPSVVVTEENKLTSYLGEFLNLLVYDNNRAYNLLQDETKKEYQNQADFKNQMIDIYSRFSSKIFSYSKKEEGNTVIYSIKDDKQNSIVITEYGIMNYKIYY